MNESSSLLSTRTKSRPRPRSNISNKQAQNDSPSSRLIQNERVYSNPPDLLSGDSFYDNNEDKVEIPFMKGVTYASQTNDSFNVRKLEARRNARIRSQSQNILYDWDGSVGNNMTNVRPMNSFDENETENMDEPKNRLSEGSLQDKYISTIGRINTIKENNRIQTRENFKSIWKNSTDVVSRAITTHFTDIKDNAEKQTFFESDNFNAGDVPSHRNESPRSAIGQEASNAVSTLFGANNLHNSNNGDSKTDLPDHFQSSHPSNSTTNTNIQNNERLDSNLNNKMQESQMHHRRVSSQSLSKAIDANKPLKIHMGTRGHGNSFGASKSNSSIAKLWFTTEGNKEYPNMLHKNTFGSANSPINVMQINIQKEPLNVGETSQNAINVQGQNISNRLPTNFQHTNLPSQSSYTIHPTINKRSRLHPDSRRQYYWNALNISLFIAYALSSFASSMPIGLIPTVAKEILLKSSAYVGEEHINDENDDGNGTGIDMDAIASTFISTVTAYAVLGTSLGKLLNGPIGDVFGARRISCLYTVLLTCSLVYLSFSTTDNSVLLSCSLVEFFQSVQWPCYTIILAAHYSCDNDGYSGENDNALPTSTVNNSSSSEKYRYEAGVYIVSMGSRLGSLAASLISTLLLRYEELSWRVVARLAALSSFFSFFILYFFVMDSPDKLHDPQNPVNSNNFYLYGYGMHNHSFRPLISQRMRDILNLIRNIFVQNIIPSLKSVLSSINFWIVAIAHSGGLMVLSSIRIIGTYFRDTSDGIISDNQAGAVGVFLSIGTLIGLGFFGNSWAYSSALDRKMMVFRLYVLTVVMCYVLAILAMPVVRSGIRSPSIVAMLQSIATFLMGCGVAVQATCIPASVSATYGENKGLYMAYTDGVAYGVSYMVWRIVGGAVEEGSPQGAGWFYGWCAVALLVILAGLLMIAFIEHYYCKNGWKKRLEYISLQQINENNPVNGRVADTVVWSSNLSNRHISIGNLFPNVGSSFMRSERKFKPHGKTPHLSFEEEENDDDSSTIIFEDISSSVDSAIYDANHDRKREKSMPLNSEDLKERLFCLLDLKGNEICVDCQSHYPRWLSIIYQNRNQNHKTQNKFSKTLGCLCCSECAGLHRKLGTHIVFVRSIDHDTFKEEEVNALEHGGNSIVNNLYEALLLNKSLKRTMPKDQFIIAKYEKLQWYKDLEQNHHQNKAVSSLSGKDVDFVEKSNLISSLEMVRNVSVLAYDDDISENGNFSVDSMNPKNMHHSSNIHNKTNEAHMKKFIKSSTANEEYESFMNQSNDSDTKLGKSHEILTQNERKLSDSSEDSSAWFMSEKKKGFSQIINL